MDPTQSACQTPGAVPDTWQRLCLPARRRPGRDPDRPPGPGGARQTGRVTYSIVAREPLTGRLGVAVQSCVFAVGTRVPFARPGVGAVAVQAASEITWGPVALDMLASGMSAADVTSALVDLDRESGTQFAVVDANGAVAAFTSWRASPQAGHATGEGVSCQANLMENDTVWDAMLRAYDETSGPLEDRLLASLQAAETESGDIRGRQSAALLIVSGSPGEVRNGYADDPVTDLRVDDHPNPVEELARLLTVKRAHDRLIRMADIEDPAGRLAEALAAARDAPDDPLCQWVAIQHLATAGRTAEAVRLLRDASARDPRTPRRLALYAASLPSSTAAANLRAVLDGA